MHAIEAVFGGLAKQGYPELPDFREREAQVSDAPALLVPAVKLRVALVEGALIPKVSLKKNLGP